MILSRSAEKPGESHECHGEDTGDEKAQRSTLQNIRHGGHLTFLAHARHQNECKRQTQSRAQSEENALQEAVTAVGLKQSQSENGARSPTFCI